MVRLVIWNAIVPLMTSPLCLWALLLTEINWDNSMDKWLQPGGRLNKKDGLTRYGNSHVKDKTS